MITSVEIDKSITLVMASPGDPGGGPREAAQTPTENVDEYNNQFEKSPFKEK